MWESASLFFTHCTSSCLIAKLLEELLGYARLFSINIGHVFTRNTIRLTALTGSAATEIGGETTHREFNISKRDDHAIDKYINSFRDTRMCVVDEISFADYHVVLSKLSKNLQNYTECRDYQYGNMPVVFLGDFCQLETISKNCIYKHVNGLYFEQALTAMVELQGTHRFRKCGLMQQVMPSLRIDGLTESHRTLLNSRVINGTTVKMPNIGTTRCATFFNNKRCLIHATIFKKYLETYHKDCDEFSIPKSAIVVRTGAHWQTSRRPLTFGHRKVLFEQCAESDCTNGGNKHCDPLLCLFAGCHVMGTENDDVANGIANGTTSKFRAITFKRGKRPSPIKLHGFWVYAIDCGDVEHIELEWHDSLFQGRFKVKPKSRCFTVNYPITECGRKMRVRTKILMYQFPVVLNLATTGHKLQGKSMDELVIAQWSRLRNWAYVVLSRVRTLAGLYLTSPIPNDIDFTPDPLYLAMMERLRAKILAIPNDVIELRTSINLAGIADHAY